MAGGWWQVAGGWLFLFYQVFFKRVCGEKMLPVGGGWGEIKIKRKYIKTTPVLVKLLSPKIVKNKK